MESHRPRILFLLAFLFSLTFAAVAPAQGTQHPFLWKIEGPEVKQPCWLYGTMHLGDDRLVDIPEVVETALDNADALFCELAMDQMAKHQLKMTKMMLLPKGQKLSEILPEDVYDMLDKRLQQLGVSASKFEKFRPWALSILMAQLEAAQSGMMKSLDNTIYLRAKNDGLEVGGLETFDEQMGAISSGKQEDHIAGLRESLLFTEKLREQGKSSMGMLLEAYLTGSEHRLLSVVDETMGPNEELNERLMKPMLEDRNIRMADRIAEKIRKNPDMSYFFAVGAAHNVGKMSVVELLRKRKLKVTRVAAPKPTKDEIRALQKEVRELRKQVRRLERRLEKVK